LHGVISGALGLALFGRSLAAQTNSDEFLGALVLLTILSLTGIFIFWQMSRLAALAQLAVPSILIVSDFSDLPTDPLDLAWVVMVAALFVFLSANAVRGTFAWHRLIRAPSAVVPGAQQPLSPT
jgi:hypothetical protein